MPSSIITFTDIQSTADAREFHLLRHGDPSPAYVLPQIESLFADGYAQALPAYDAAKVIFAAARCFNSFGNDVEAIEEITGHDVSWRYEVSRAKYNNNIIVHTWRECDGKTFKGVRHGWFEIAYGRLKDQLILIDLIEQSGEQKRPVRIDIPKALDAMGLGRKAAA